MYNITAADTAEHQTLAARTVVVVAAIIARSMGATTVTAATTAEAATAAVKVVAVAEFTTAAVVVVVATELINMIADYETKTSPLTTVHHIPAYYITSFTVHIPE
jgi:hypothetical protein